VDAVFTRSPSSSHEGPLTLTWAGPLPQHAPPRELTGRLAARRVLHRRELLGVEAATTSCSEVGELAGLLTTRRMLRAWELGS
jgi:hypothetical protein